IQVPHSYAGAGLAWAPDGSYLVGAFDSPIALYRFDLAGGSKLLTSAFYVGQITAADVSHDGQLVYLSAGNCNYNEIVYKVLATGSGPTRVSTATADDCFDLVHADISLAPDGRSEERRVGKEGRSRWATESRKKKNKEVNKD